MKATLEKEKEYSERGKRYTAAAKSKVTVISILDEVAIVENEKHHRFSIRTEYLKIIN